VKEERRAFILEHGVDCTVNGVATKAVIGRVGRKTSASAWENERQGSFLPDITVPGGALVENAVTGESYLARSVYPEVVDGDVVAKLTQMLKINATTNILRLTNTYDAYGNVTGNAWLDTATGTDVLTPVKAFAEWISAAMRQTDPGLLATTIIRLYVQATAVIALLDRVMLGGKAYQVDAIDLLSSPGLAVVQLSGDTRG
jgi:hypothetical protein